MKLVNAFLVEVTSGCPVAALSCVQLRSDWVELIEKEGMKGFEKAVQKSVKFPSLRARGRPARKDVAQALRLSRKGVPRKEIYKLLGIVPAARRRFRQAFCQQKRRNQGRKPPKMAS